MNPRGNLHAPYVRRNWAVALLIAQVLAAIAAFVAACIEIHSIVVTGPILAVVGIALAIVSHPWMSPHALLFSLSAPLTAALGALVIAAFRLGPRDARGPVYFILAIYLLLVALRSIPLFRYVLSQPPPPPKPSARIWQYSLKSLLGLMTAVAVFAGISTGLALADFQIGFAVFGLASVTASAVIAWQCIVAWSEPDSSTQTATLPFRPPAD